MSAKTITILYFLNQMCSWLWSAHAWFHKITFVQEVCVIQTPCDRLNMFYSFNLTAVIGIVSRRDLSIDKCHRNQTNGSKPVLY